MVKVHGNTHVFVLPHSYLQKNVHVPCNVFNNAHFFHLHVQWNLSNTNVLGPIKCALIREGGVLISGDKLYEVGTWSSVLIREVSLIQWCPLTLYCPMTPYGVMTL